MASMVANDKKTSTQKLPELVEWYLLDNKVQLKFVPYTQGMRGKSAPEFDFQYWMDDRRITERCLCMCIMTELQKRDYNYNIAKIMAALTSLAWKNYIAVQPYPEWFREESTKVHKRPRGRPRQHPKALAFPENVEVNITEPQIEEAE